MTAIRRAFFAGVGICTLTAASVAWACTAGGYVTVNPTSGVAGATVNVSGSGFMAPSQEAEVGPVQIRWNSTSGPLLATAGGPSFSIDVVIPEKASPRTYYIVGVQRATDGSIVRDGTVAFTVNEAGPSSREGWRTGQQPAEVAPTEASSPQDQSGGQADGPPAAGGAETTPASTDAPAATDDRNTARATTDASRARSTSETAKGGGTDGGPPSGPPGEDAGQPPAGPSDGAAEPASQAVAVGGPSGSLHSISSDVWSGFASPSSSGPGGPSLIGSPAPNGAAETDGLRLGLALLALGSAGLVGGGFAALRTRRRTVA